MSDDIPIDDLIRELDKSADKENLVRFVLVKCLKDEQEFSADDERSYLAHEDCNMGFQMV